MIGAVASGTTGLEASGAAGLEPSGAAGQVAGDREQQLREAAAAMESVFMSEMLKAMRATVPGDGVFESGAGETIFTGMLDDHVAGLAAARQAHGVGDALFRQLRSLITSDSTAEPVG